MHKFPISGGRGRFYHLSIGHHENAIFEYFPFRLLTPGYLEKHFLARSSVGKMSDDW